MNRSKTCYQGFGVWCSFDHGEAKGGCRRMQDDIISHQDEAKQAELFD